MAFPGFQDLFVWKAPVSDIDGRYDPILNGVFSELQKCVAYTGIKRRTSSIAETSDYQEKLNVAITIMLEDVMGNYTFLVNEQKSDQCINGHWITFSNNKYGYKMDACFNCVKLLLNYVLPKEGHFKNPFITASQQSHLIFITCGQRGIDRLMFQELFSVYDKYVWFFVGIFTVILCLVFTGAYGNSPGKTFKTSKPMENLLSVLKALLEQGDPFSRHLDHAPHLRWILAAVPLAASVLS